jgi:hypothetical protein
MKTSIIKRKQTFSRDGATSSASAKASAFAEASGSLALPNRREAAAALISDFGLRFARIRANSREFAFTKNKNMRKREPSKLDPFADNGF